MKNLLLSAFAVIFFSITSFSQVKEVKFGVKIFPAVAWSRVSPEKFVDATNQEYTFSDNGIKLRGGIGIFADYHFTDNYVFTTGLNYLVNSSGYNIKTPTGEIKNRYSLQYVQVPIAFKLITNELADMLKVYFALGVTGDILVGTRINGEKELQVAPAAPVEKNSRFIFPISSNLNISSGIEYEISGGTKLLIGLTYSHGLANIDSGKSGVSKAYNTFAILNNYLALDLGIKF